MTPKSVSGTSLILALGAVLAWPVLGWAEITMTWTKKHEKDLTHTIIVTQGHHDLYMACGGRICATGATQDEATATMACYQRMREAMRSMEAFLRQQVLIPAEDYARIKDQWNATVKDCVEDSK